MSPTQPSSIAAFVTLLGVGLDGAAARAACGQEWQRACCLQEHAPGAPSCADGLTESYTCGGVHIDDIDKWGHPPQCQCEVGPGYARGECIDDTKDLPFIASCWFHPDDKAAAPPDDVAARRSLSLYVVGFNHDTIDTHRNVRRVGLEELYEAILSDSELDPQDLVVAFDEAGIPDDGCDPGDFPEAASHASLIPTAPIDRLPNHAECLARMLNEAPAMQGKAFRLSEWDYHARGWDPVTNGIHISTMALVTGERWSPVATYELQVPIADEPADYACADRDPRCLAVYGVRLRGAAPPFGDATFVIYLVHTEGQPATEVNLERITAKIQSADYQRPDDLPPLLVGDFNSRVSDGLDANTAASYAWANKDVSCNGSALEMETDILHIFSGRPASEAAPAGFWSQQDKTPAAFLAPLRARYARAEDSLAPLEDPPGHKRVGVWLPHSSHNVVAMDFGVAFTQADLVPPICCTNTTPGSTAAHMSWVGLVLLWLRRRGREP